MKAPTKKAVSDAAIVLLAYFVSQLNAVSTAPAKGGKKPKDSSADELSLDDEELSTDEPGDDLDLGLDDGTGGNDLDNPDERYNELRALLTKIAKATKSKKIGYKILDKVNSKDVDAVSPEDLDLVLKVAKNWISKNKK